MGIKIRQPGEVTVAGQAAVAAGRAKGATQKQVMAERKQARTEQIQAQRTARKTAIDWELQKMQMRSQQDFQQELADKQWEYDKFNRAQAWQIEKMEMASRMDFEREERNRQKRLDELDSADAAIDKAVAEGRYAENQVAAQRFKNEMARYNITGSLSREKEPGILSLLGETPPTVTPDITENPLGLNIVTPTQVSQLPPEQLELMREQKFRVISPDGDEETIDESQWVDYKARGYILAEIPELRERLARRDRIQFPGTMF
jgi:hypothetical protein